MSRNIKIGEILADASSAVGRLGEAYDTNGMFSKTMEHVNGVIGPFMPFLVVISTLTKEIVESYENVQYNKKTCGVLVTRVEVAEVAIKKLMREKEDNIDKFRSLVYYKSFENFVICLKKIKDFCNDISQLSKFKKFFTSGNIKENFQEIIKEFDSCSNDLNLTISISTNEQMNKDLSVLQTDMIEMKKFLDNVEGGITSLDYNTKKSINTTNEIKIQNQEIIIKINNIEEQNNKIIEQNNKILEYKNKHKSLDFTPLNTEIETIYILNKEINDQNSTIEAKRIDPSELKDTSQYVAPRRGSRVKIQKKIYKELDVACKPISMDNIQKIAILEKLNICPYIIQFHGLSEIAEENVLVFQWAEHGTLRELYRNFNITWKAKILIARDICRGLAFLHSVNIFHHDLKCDNILITENMQPKISNFNLSREFNDATLPIDNFNDMIHWLAPEKLPIKQNHQKQDGNRYTIQCEIFSFGMLLWELGFQKKPYENMKLIEILDHVSNGGRETLDIGSCYNSIQKEYYLIIKLAWNHEPSLRPGIRHLFNMLQELYENHNILKRSPLLLNPKSQVVKNTYLSFFFVFKFVYFVYLPLLFFLNQFLI